MILLDKARTGIVDSLLKQFDFEEYEKYAIVLSDWKEEIDRSKNEDIEPDYENLLGEYYSSSSVIMLYLDGIQYQAEKLKCTFIDLFTIVLIHELGHYVFNKALLENKRLTTEKYDAINENIHELFAQLITYEHLKNNSNLLSVFTTLANQQSTKYKTYQLFSSKIENGWSDMKNYMLEARNNPGDFFEAHRHI